MTEPTPPEWDKPQPEYSQPPAHAPQHGEPMGPMTTRFAKLDPGPSYAFGAVGATIALLGGVLLVVAFTAVDWFTHATLNGPSHFSDLHDLLKKLDILNAANSLSSAYFSWLAWTLLAVAVVAAILACVPGATSTVFRAIGALAALAGVALSFAAIAIFKSGVRGAPSYSEQLKHSRLGFYLAITGFVLVGVGALIGPRKADN